MVKGFYRCGICDKDFTSSEEWDIHAQTLEHKMKVIKFRMMMIDARIKGEHVNVREFARKIRNEGKKEMMHTLNKTIKFENLSDAYAIIEIYDFGTVNQRAYREACRYALEHFRKKYGKDSFWFRELFAYMQHDGWEGTFEIRSLLHAEVIGCPHKTITECDKHKSESALKILKGKKCQHCRYIEGVKEKWEEKEN